MFGLDDKIATLGSGDVFLIVMAVAVLLGLRHATTLFLFGLPIVLANSYLPKTAQEIAELAVGVMIVVLAVRLLLRWHRGELRPHSHTQRTRSATQAYGIGLVHGVGGSAGVGVLLLAAIHNHVESIAALFVFAFFTAISMSIASASFGYGMSRGPVLHRFVRVAPVMGMLSLAFGAWYALGAIGAVPYVL